MASASDFILLADPVTAGQTGTITLSRPSGQYHPTFTVTFGEVDEPLAVELLSESETRQVYRWQAPRYWCRWLPESVWGEGTITASIAFDSAIDALDDPLVCTLSTPFTLYVPDDAVSTVTVTAEVVNDNPTAADWGIALRDRSRIRYTVSAVAAEGTDIESCLFTWGGQSIEGMEGLTPPLTAAGTVVPTARVRDGRGRTVTATAAPITVWDYHEPTLSAVSVLRCTADGTVDREGDHLTLRASAACASVGGRNRVRLQVRIRPVGGQWGESIPLTSGSALLLQADTDAVYEAMFSALDSLGSEKTVLCRSGSAAVAFHLREGGLGAAFGKRAQDEGFHCAWDACFDGAMAVGGALQAAALQVGGKSLLDLTYPVGSVYMSFSEVSPAILFGGQWQRIEGAFLLGADDTRAPGSAGGAAAHSLTTAQLPPHSHRVLGYTDAENVGHYHTIPNIRTGQSGEYGAYAETWGNGSGERDLTTDFTDITHNHRVDITSQTAGTGAAFPILPPYLAVLMWQRTA